MSFVFAVLCRFPLGFVFACSHVFVLVFVFVLAFVIGLVFTYVFAFVFDFIFSYVFVSVFAWFNFLPPPTEGQRLETLLEERQTPEEKEAVALRDRGYGPTSSLATLRLFDAPEGTGIATAASATVAAAVVVAAAAAANAHSL